MTPCIQCHRPVGSVSVVSRLVKVVSHHCPHCGRTWVECSMVQEYDHKKFLAEISHLEALPAPHHPVVYAKLRFMRARVKDHTYKDMEYRERLRKLSLELYEARFIREATEGL